MSLRSISTFVTTEIARDVTNEQTLQNYFPNVRTNDCDLTIQGLNVCFNNRLSTVPSADPGTKLARKMEE
jgi:hypothetical protein